MPPSRGASLGMKMAARRAVFATFRRTPGYLRLSGTLRAFAQVGGTPNQNYDI
jgi:hypothetical protein